MSEQKLSLLKSKLAEQRFKLTTPRKRVFDALHADKPLQMREVIELTQSKVDRVSVYRTIDLFEKLGIVHRIYIGWKYKLELSDDFIDHHHHLTCLQCGKVVDIEDMHHIDEFIDEIAKKAGFTPQSHQFEITGHCSTCL